VRLGTATFEQTLADATLTDAAALRHAIEHEFACLGKAVGDAAIVLTELFTNAVRHGRTPITVRAVPFDGGVQLRVHDGSRRFGTAGPDSRGLQLIASVARAWGVDRFGEGKAVWADVEARA
jgi:two-component sensor histidine kinase